MEVHMQNCRSGHAFEKCGVEFDRLDFLIYKERKPPGYNYNDVLRFHHIHHLSKSIVQLLIN